MENNNEKIKFVEETLEKLLKESNELWDEGRDKSFIIGYLLVVNFAIIILFYFY